MTSFDVIYWRLRNITRMVRARHESDTLKVWALALFGVAVFLLAAAR